MTAGGTQLAAAPVSWGVWELTVDRTDLVDHEALLGSVHALGFQGIELGPPGYLGRDGRAVRDALHRFGLALVGAFVPLRLADELGFRTDLDELERTLEILASANASGVVLLADAGNAERQHAAGRPHELDRTGLRDKAFARLAGRATRAAERARERGVGAAFHPEIGSYVESPAEIEQLLALTDAEVLSLCLDTGHIVVGGGDPLEVAREHPTRVAHLHLKDVHPAILARLRAGELSLHVAWETGLFCPFGDGVVDLAGLLALDDIRDFRGWIVLEQDRVAVRADDLESVRAVEARNLDLVTNLIAHAVQT